MTRMPIALLVLAFAAPAAAQITDEKKTSTALLAEAARAEVEQQYPKAIEKAQKAADKAGTEGRKDVAARALQVVGRSNEMLTPENVDAAQGAYQRIVGEFGDQDPVASWAREKIARRGVDVWLETYHQALLKARDDERALHTQLTDLRFVPESDARVMDVRKKLDDLKTWVDEQKGVLWAKIKPLNKDAIHGLLTGLPRKDEVVRDVAAEFLAEVVDEGGIATLISKLPDDEYRSGAALALNKVFLEYARANKFDEEAFKVEEDLTNLKPPSEPEAWATGAVLKEEDAARLREAAQRAQRVVASNRERVAALRAKANEIRGNIPVSLDAPRILDELRDALADDKHPAAQVEAAKALESIGELSGPLVDTLLTGLASKDRNVRLACCIAAGSVDTTKNADRRRIAERLIEIVKYEPEVENKPGSDHANEPAVRAAAATSLGRIGIIKAIPALIDALEDNAADVRGRAHDALVMVTGRALGYESEPHVADAGLSNPDPKQRKMEEDAAKRAKQLELRKKGVEEWKAWWQETEGIVCLVERFWRFQGGWKAFEPTRLFDKDGFLQEIRSQSYVFIDPVDAGKRADRAVDRFQKQKSFLQEDAIETGAEAIPKLMKYIGGVLPDLEKGLTTEVIRKSRSATRMFVAETIARLAAKGGGDTLSGLRDMVSAGASADEKAGACLAIGFFPPGSVSAQDREVLDKRGLAESDVIVREAGARALRHVGDASNAGGLALVATSNQGENLPAQKWALRALAALKPKNPDTVRALGELVGHEQEGSDRTSTDSLVRELACDGLGEIGDPAAVADLYLLRARRDLSLNVREAAQRAIRKIGAAEASVADSVMKVLKDDHAKAADRIGAALAMGDLGQDKYVTALVYRLVDENAPTVLKDGDPAVRAAVSRGLGIMGDKARFKIAGDKLLEAMETEATSEQIRRDAYLALTAIAGEGAGVPAYEPADPAPKRATQVEEIRKWWASAKSSWRDAPQ